MVSLDRPRRTISGLVEVARFGGLRTGEEPTEFDVVLRTSIFRLRRYPGPDAAEDGTRVAAVLVPPLMLTAEVYDVSPATSAVQALAECGIEPWVVDFGVPESEPGGMRRTLSEHVLAISEAVDKVRAETGTDVHLVGYSQGGMFCYQTAAYRRNEGIAGIVAFGSPVDLRGTAPLKLPEPVAVAGAKLLSGGGLIRRTGAPGWATRTGFQLLDPVGAVRSRMQFLAALHDRETLLPREGQRRYLMREGWIGWPGPALDEFLRQFVLSNRMLAGGIAINDRPITLADLDGPVLIFVGERDDIAPPAAVRAVRRAAPAAGVDEVALPTGHFGLVVGRSARTTTWPTVAAWMRWSSGVGPRPEGVHPVRDEEATSPEHVRVAPVAAAKAGVGAGLSVANQVTRGVGSLFSLVRDATGVPGAQLSRLSRLQSIRPDTRISLASLLSERAEQQSDGVGLLWGDRIYSYEAMERTVDLVVGMLLADGVRRGEPVGICMSTRPTALTLVIALNRIGAVAVMLRPGPEAQGDAELGGVRRVYADRAVDFGPSVVSREYLVPDPAVASDDQVAPTGTPPGWYRKNSGRADEVAFVLFTGSGDARVRHDLTNHRYALSALSAATAATLSEQDTIYGIGALYHQSGLLTLLGAGLASGARIAMASSFDAATFWSEVRRYGVTAVSYTWNQLEVIAFGPEFLGERHHGIRLFLGSGVPRGLWRQLDERFAPARVLEFWASAESNAVLAEVRSHKIGCVGRPIPGSAPVAVAAIDPVTRKLRLRSDGFAEPAADEEIGLLLVRVATDQTPPLAALRDVFIAGDAWIDTGSLFRRDRDSDHWLVDRVEDVFVTDAGVVYPRLIAEALSDLQCVRKTVALHLRDDNGNDLAAAAIELQQGAAISSLDISAAVGHVDGTAPPDLVAVVDSIPTTSWYRPHLDVTDEAALRARATQVWRREDGHYKETWASGDLNNDN